MRTLGQTDELVSAKGTEVESRHGARLGHGRRVLRRGRSVDATSTQALAGTDLVDGVTPAIIEQIAVQAPEQRQTEPRVTLFAADPGRMDGFGAIEGTDGEVTLADLGRSEAFLNEEAADELGVGAGDRVLIFAGGPALRVTVKDVVRFEGAGTAELGALPPARRGAGVRRAARAQVRHVLVSNRGDEWSGAGLSDEVVDRLEPALAPLGLDVDAVEEDAIEAADVQGSAFMAFFTTFGSFSIAAGILLIFLVFVMLATERRGELGHRPRDRHAARPPRPDLHLRGRRLRPRSPPSSAPSSAPRSPS